MSQLGLARGMAAGHRRRPKMRRPCASVHSSRFRATRCWWCRRAACGRRAESAKIRYKGARFVPMSVVESLLAGESDRRGSLVGGRRERVPDASHGAHGPFEIALRSSAGVDRHAAAASWSRTPPRAWSSRAARACGPWCSSRTPRPPSDGKRRFEARSCCWPIRASAANARAVGAARRRPSGNPGRRLKPPIRSKQPRSKRYWLLSLYTPSANDAVDWKRGSYSTVSRGGRIESSARWGEPKSPTLMIAEGSVLLAVERIARRGAATWRPAGFPHPVYRAGFAVAVPIPWRAAA